MIPTEKLSAEIEMSDTEPEGVKPMVVCNTVFADDNLQEVIEDCHSPNEILKDATVDNQLRRNYFPELRRNQESENVNKSEIRLFLVKDVSTDGFVIPCSVGSHDILGLVDFRSSINIMPLSIFLKLKLIHLWKTDMAIEMANMTKATPMGITGGI